MISPVYTAVPNKTVGHCTSFPRRREVGFANGGNDEFKARVEGCGRNPLDYFGAYLRDHDGNKLYFCCHQPAS